MGTTVKREKQKNISAKTIFGTYFSLIDSYFGSLKHHIKDEEDSHIRFANRVSSYPIVSELLYDATEELGEEIHKFWQTNYKSVRSILQSSKGLKCVYSGDFSPTELEAFIKKTALYVDTIVLPDPILNLELFRRGVIDREYYLNKLIKHSFNIQKLKDLILADTANQIVVLYPTNMQTLGDKQVDEFLVQGKTMHLNYFNNLLGANFQASEEIFEFTHGINSTADFFSKIKDSSILPNALKTPTKYEEQMVKMLKIGNKFNLPGSKSINHYFATYSQSQFIRVQEHKFYCQMLQAEPIYDYDLPWFFLNYDQGGFDIDPAIINALQKENFEWLGNIPLDALKVLREENQLDYMRSMMRQGIFSLKTKSDSELNNVAQQLEENFKQAFKQQKSEMDNLKKTVGNVIKKDIPIAIGEFLVGFIPAIGNFITLPFTARSIYKSYKDARNDLNVEKENIVNLLMQSYEKK